MQVDGIVPGQQPGPEQDESTTLSGSSEATTVPVAEEAPEAEAVLPPAPSASSGESVADLAGARAGLQTTGTTPEPALPGGEPGDVILQDPKVEKDVLPDTATTADTATVDTVHKALTEDGNDNLSSLEKAMGGALVEPKEVSQTQPASAPREPIGTPQGDYLKPEPGNASGVAEPVAAVPGPNESAKADVPPTAALEISADPIIPGAESTALSQPELHAVPAGAEVGATGVAVPPVPVGTETTTPAGPSQPLVPDQRVDYRADSPEGQRMAAREEEKDNAARQLETLRAERLELDKKLRIAFLSLPEDMKRAEEINQEMDHWLKVYMGKSDQTTPATPTTPEAIKGETA